MSSITAADTTAPLHPYYPIGIALSGDVFVANDWSASSLVLGFAAGLASILGVAWLVMMKINPRLKASDRALVLWFVSTGSIHVFFEGYFVLNHHRMGGMQDFFGQLWKEYALSDSRYMLSDPFLLCIETSTVITWGPLSFLTALLIIRESPYRHSIQALVSTGHIYGDGLYFATSLLDEFYSGKIYYRPEPFYFWVYFVFMNILWLIIPGFCLYGSIKASAEAFAISSKVSASKTAKKRS
ncbi:hypothetical protein M430DRAFT_39664 [Amorphotheca resinae ATCC 22711]|uniref:EXPERA domain-containing protein n=1 Tax=Amorphotheca resinae ATCC 22711 TaxID=857342 RepID=A0A2T3BBA6_AMORE|nr:hypothetical protein M430DRAFT_39664 [Amorphotheca resinae ATCC 22711]PSS25605.1 hypothetical protein M430DRAFT_39664 [Amorphotheca resinae ATCC 22711]